MKKSEIKAAIADGIVSDDIRDLFFISECISKQKSVIKLFMQIKGRDNEDEVVNELFRKMRNFRLGGIVKNAVAMYIAMSEKEIDKSNKSLYSSIRSIKAKIKDVKVKANEVLDCLIKCASVLYSTLNKSQARDAAVEYLAIAVDALLEATKVGIGEVDYVIRDLNAIESPADASESEDEESIIPTEETPAEEATENTQAVAEDTQAESVEILTPAVPVAEYGKVG